MERLNGSVARTPSELATVAAIVCCLAIAATTLVSALGWSELSTPMTVALEPNSVEVQAPNGAPFDEVTGTVAVDTGAGWRMLWWLVTDVRWLLAAAGLEFLRRILRSRPNVFVAANVTRLRAIAALAGTYQVIALIRGPVDVLLSARVGFGELATAEQLGAPAIVAILAAALAHVWHEGIELRAEQELTV